MAGITTYQKKSVPQLIKIAVRHFHSFIRNRDEGKPCVSCGKYTTLQAGHFYSAGHYPALRFDPDNVHGQCKRCNYFLHGNPIEYEKTLIHRIGEKALSVLHLKAAHYKRNRFKWDRFSLIGTIKKYT